MNMVIKKNSIKIIPIKIIYIVLLSFIFYSARGDVVSVDGNIIGLICMFFILIGLMLKLLTGNSNIKKDSIYLFMMYLIPYILFISYTLCLNYIQGGLAYDQLGRAVSMFLNSSISIILVLSVYYLFGQKTIKYTYYACILNYCVVIIKFIMDYGINGLFHFIELNESWTARYLEVHELTFIFGLFFIYYFLLKEKKENYIKIIILSLFIFLGYKRITFLALGVVILIDFILNKINLKNRGKVIKIGSIILFLCSIAYLWVCTNGYDFLVGISQEYNIDFMGRLDVFKYLINNEKLNLLFEGNGYMYGEALLNNNNVNNIVAVHNDILRMYLEYGFIGFCIYFINIIFCNYNRLEKRFSHNSSNAYILFLIYTIIHYTTDNLIIYPRYIFVNFLFIYFISIEKKKGEKI